MNFYVIDLIQKKKNFTKKTYFCSYVYQTALLLKNYVFFRVYMCVLHRKKKLFSGGRIFNLETFMLSLAKQHTFD